ncbi:MAG TPA: Ku protein [Desulfomonilaceae bacterium]|nr:Ku protein [Desulfomonilaceae bacterium]
MARALWSGSISFGLVNIPVKLYSAIHDNDIHFHQIQEKTKCRVHHKLYCPGHGEVSSDEIVKGYEIAPNEYVIIKKEELDALAPEETRGIEITDFVDLGSIDPMYYDKPYYVLPDTSATKAYQLLVTAMITSGKVGIAKFVMRNKEYLAALRPVGEVICLELMRFASEVVSADKLEAFPTKVEVGDRELNMARQLIESLAGSFQPDTYHDEYTERLQALIERKAQGKEIVVEPSAGESKGQVIDLMAALEKSLARASKKRSGKTTAKSAKQRKGKTA